MTAIGWNRRRRPEINPGLQPTSAQRWLRNTWLQKMDEQCSSICVHYSPTTMDPSQHSHNPIHPNLYETVRDRRVEDLDQYTDLFDTQLTPNHNTIHHVATHFVKLEERHHDIVQSLIECAKELDHVDPESAIGTRLEILMTSNVYGDTALHLEVQAGDAEIVSLLVAKDPNFQHPSNKAEETPVYLVVERHGGGSMVESILASSTSLHRS
ncbi:hypothetical protein Vadar_027868 [Vaccinium darrowii]|uniref:Uncharacterized protein n=1 Tax=Vaccinium darrowii TaxID=229202 RepID=A0ACB7XTS8_9ERIC|nr:hypothetical protein Vadar_027868 [Vaccinium darrowii]